MKNNRLLRVSALIALLIPSAILLSRHHDRAVRARRVRRLQGILERSWIQPLRRDQSALSMSEFDGLAAFRRRPGVTGLVYFNRYAEVRWAEDPKQTTKELFEFTKSHPLPESTIDAHTVRLPFIEPLPGRTSCAISIPLLERGFVQGLVRFNATDDALSDLADRGTELFPPAISRPARTRRGTEKEQESEQMYLNGLLYFQMGQDDRARKDWERAVELDPGDDEAREGLARLRPAQTGQ
jgi:tetratricopeptide (TPR) repeat protein